MNNGNADYQYIFSYISSEKLKYKVVYIKLPNIFNQILSHNIVAKKSKDKPDIQFQTPLKLQTRSSL